MQRQVRISMTVRMMLAIAVTHDILMEYEKNDNDKCITQFHNNNSNKITGTSYFWEPLVYKVVTPSIKSCSAIIYARSIAHYYFVHTFFRFILSFIFTIDSERKGEGQRKKRLFERQNTFLPSHRFFSRDLFMSPATFSRPLSRYPFIFLLSQLLETWQSLQCPAGQRKWRTQ